MPNFDDLAAAELRARVGDGLPWEKSAEMAGLAAERDRENYYRGLMADLLRMVRRDRVQDAQNIYGTLAVDGSYPDIRDRAFAFRQRLVAAGLVDQVDAQRMNFNPPMTDDQKAVFLAEVREKARLQARIDDLLAAAGRENRTEALNIYSRLPGVRCDSKIDHFEQELRRSGLLPGVVKQVKAAADKMLRGWSDK